jgi:hypothetical protein
MNACGRNLLSSAKLTLPMISAYKHVQNLPQAAQNVYKLECHADDLWSLMTPKIQSCGANMTSKIIIM